MLPPKLPEAAIPSALSAEPPVQWRDWLRAFIPARTAINAKERWRAIIGGLIGVLIAALICQGLSGLALPSVWLVAPLGASTVLVFAAPASPLAQPWSVIGGNTVSAMVGTACALWVPGLIPSAALAVALAIGAMLALRCLHPPGGAMALSAVLVHASHGQFPVSTALCNSLLLVSIGVVYNTATGRRYPRMQIASRNKEAHAGARFKSEDLDAVLARYNQVLDVSRDDLEALLQEAEMEGYRRRVGEIRCKDVMTRDVVTIEFGATLQDAWHLMHEHSIKALPVIDRSRRVVGIITMADFLRAARIDGPHNFGAKLRDFIRPDGLTHSTKPEVVGQIMTRQVRVTSEDLHAVALMPLFAEAGHHHIPVIDADKRIVGIITQSDFVRALYQTNG